MKIYPGVVLRQNNAFFAMFRPKDDFCFLEIAGY